MSRMLIVEDDPAWRSLYRVAFEGQFEVFEATDGYQALSVLDAVRPDVILLDLRMPRMDGLDFIRRLERRGGPRPPIIVCSGTFGEHDRPLIPGVALAVKTADLGEVWQALRAAVPELLEASAAKKPGTRAADHLLWRD